MVERSRIYINYFKSDRNESKFDEHVQVRVTILSGGLQDLGMTSKSSLVSALYINKQTIYTESKIFPFCEMADLGGVLV